SLCEALQDALGKRGFDVVWRTRGEDALDALRADELDVVVTDLRMQGMSGLELCQRIVENRPDIPVIVITAFGTVEHAIGAIRAGAYDFITKPIETDVLVVALERAIQHRRLRDEVKTLRRAIEDARHFGKLIGSSAAMQAGFDLLRRVAGSAAEGALTGE